MNGFRLISNDYDTETICCSHKVYSKSGCYCCFHCPKCGARGCDNLIYVRDFSRHRSVQCPRDEAILDYSI